jgi:hypothetical protein
MLQRARELAASLALPARLLVIAFPGHRGTASLLDQAHRLKARCTEPIAVVQITP